MPQVISSGRMGPRRLLPEPAAPGPDLQPHDQRGRPDLQPDRPRSRTAGRQEGRTPCSSLDPPQLRPMISSPHPDARTDRPTSGPPDLRTLRHDQQPDGRTSSGPCSPAPRRLDPAADPDRTGPTAAAPQQARPDGSSLWISYPQPPKTAEKRPKLSTCPWLPQKGPD